MSDPRDVYRIELPQFEGPFDLLLFFIERDELDIRDIPIARITDDFLAYLHEAKRLDITLAGDFIVVAATLMSIKARVLIPRLPVDEHGEEVDPRQELVDRLLEYKRYKEVLDDLRRLEAERGQRHGRPYHADQFAAVVGEAMAEAEWESLTLYRLLKAFERVLARKAEREKPVHRVVRWPYTVEEEGVRIRRALTLRGRVPFVVLFGACRDRVHAIVTFLALLELINGSEVRIEVREDSGANDFVICGEVEEVEEGEGAKEMEEVEGGEGVEEGEGMEVGTV